MVCLGRLLSILPPTLVSLGSGMEGNFFFCFDLIWSACGVLALETGKETREKGVGVGKNEHERSHGVLIAWSSKGEVTDGNNNIIIIVIIISIVVRHGKKSCEKGRKDGKEWESYHWSSSRDHDPSWSSDLQKTWHISTTIPPTNPCPTWTAAPSAMELRPVLLSPR